MYTKEDFIRIYQQSITRPGADKLLAWLEQTDFFEAPASTRFHSSFPGGLCHHTVGVFQRLTMLLDTIPGAPDCTPETVAIAALLHDVCKANFYAVEMRNRKNDRGQWEKYPFYIVDEKFPYGHGEKSVFLIERFMHLTNEEAVAIRYHMGAFDDGTRQSFCHAVEKFPLAFYLHTADMMASHFDETKEEA